MTIPVPHDFSFVCRVPAGPPNFHYPLLPRRALREGRRFTISQKPVYVGRRMADGPPTSVVAEPEGWGVAITLGPVGALALYAEGIRNLLLCPAPLDSELLHETSDAFARSEHPFRQGGPSTLSPSAASYKKLQEEKP